MLVTELPQACLVTDRETRQEQQTSCGRMPVVVELTTEWLCDQKGVAGPGQWLLTDLH